jgi:rhodanese-related sulfurtransferase
LVTEARSRIRRYTPAEVRADSALIVDIRSADERERSGVIPGSKHAPLSTVLWRADQTSEWRDDDLAGRRLCLICQHGESSSLAAAALVHLGVDAGDLIGGYEAW